MYSDQFPAGPAWGRTPRRVECPRRTSANRRFPGTIPESWSPSHQRGRPVDRADLEQMRAGGIHSAVSVVKGCRRSRSGLFGPELR